jgi:hypothetical protein
MARYPFRISEQSAVAFMDEMNRTGVSFHMTMPWPKGKSVPSRDDAIALHCPNLAIAITGHVRTVTRRYSAEKYTDDIVVEVGKRFRFHVVGIDD